MFPVPSFSFRHEIKEFWDYEIWLGAGNGTSVERAERSRYWAGDNAEILQRELDRRRHSCRPLLCV
jgi:hypothetical protein